MRFFSVVVVSLFLFWCLLIGTTQCSYVCQSVYKMLVLIPSDTPSRPRQQYDPTGIKDYIRQCNNLGIIPVSYFKRHVNDRKFVMRSHGLGPLGAKAIAKPLMVSVIR